MEHLIAEFAFGNLPHHEAEKNLRLFADKVMPVLQRDPAYALAKSSSPVSDAPTAKRAANDGIFAPA